MFNGIFDQNDRRVRRFDAPKVKQALFQQGDLVKYTGAQLNELGGKIGTVCARVGGEEFLVTVDFGEDQAYLVDERNLARTLPKVKEEEKEEKGPKVEKRKGVGKGKRARQSDSAE
jgi:hypothetical protein